jgi:hypothetical protein
MNKWPIIAWCGIALVSAYFLFKGEDRHELSLSKPKINEMQLLTELKKIGSHAINTTDVTIFKEISGSTTYRNIVQSGKCQMTNGSRVVAVTINGNEVEKNAEVKQSFRIWLSLSEYELPYSISCIDLGYLLNSDQKKEIEIIISNTDFQNLIQQNDLHGLSFEDKVNVLSNAWIKMNNYVRFDSKAFN